MEITGSNILNMWFVLIAVPSTQIQIFPEGKRPKCIKIFKIELYVAYLIKIIYYYSKLVLMHRVL